MVNIKNSAQGVAKEEARYSGARFSPPLNNAPEIKHRLRAIVIGWKRLGNFLFSSAPYKMKRLCFLSQVVSAAVSAGHSFVFTTAESGKLDVQIVKLLRAMLQGEAYEEDPMGGKGKP